MADDTFPSPPRPIKSFVLRAGRVGSGQERALAELGPRFVLPYAAQPLDAAHVFGRSAPLVLEIGFGMGRRHREHRAGAAGHRFPRRRGAPAPASAHCSSRSASGS